jgi:predicted porin
MVNGTLLYEGGNVKVGFGAQVYTGVRGAGLNDVWHTLTGGYTFGPAYVAAVYSYHKADVTAGQSVSRKFWGASTTYTTGPGRIYAFYGKVGNGSVNNPGLGNTGAQMYEVSYTYNLSKRTSLYSGYVRLKNDANANYALVQNGLSSDTGASTSGVVAGIRHAF